MTLAMRLSQSLKDPLRSKDFLGQVTKGEIQIDCQHHSKFLTLKNRKGLLTDDAIQNLIELIKISDTNWYEKFGIFKGGEENFCSGSDVRELAAMGIGSPGQQCPQMEKLRGKYELCYLLSKSPKTRLALLDGNCLGAGAGLALAHMAAPSSDKKKPKVQHFRVATDRTVFSLQHAHFLGTFPGFGASHFLPQLRGAVGLYLALSGARINGVDCLFAGVATHFMPPHRLSRCLQALIDHGAEISEDQIKAILDDHSTPTKDKEMRTYPSPPTYYQRYSMGGVADETHLEDNFDAIQRCFGQATVDGVLDALAKESSPWASRTLAQVQAMAPLALRVTFELFRRGQTCSFEDALSIEWRLARRFYGHPDFFEAVRALEVEKDGAPRWAPPPSPEEVSRMFGPMSEAECLPLDMSSWQLHLSDNNKAAFGRGEMRV